MNRPLRVVHVVRSDGYAGVEAHVARLAHQQALQGLDVRVAGGQSEAMTRELRGVVAHTAASSVWQVLRAVDRCRGADILHAHITAAELGATLAVRAAAPLVVTRHFAAPRGTSRLGRLAAPVVRRRVAVQIAISSYVADHIDGPSVVIHPGVPEPQVERLQPAEQVILVAQRLEAEKRTELAIRAFAASGLAGQGWQLHVAGDGSQRTMLEALAARLVPGQVRFLGHRADVPQRMARAAMVLASCKVEGLGLSVVEAMALGVPVVAAAAGGHLETVGGVADAALFAPDDEHEAGGLLRELAAGPQRRADYGARLREYQRAEFALPEQASRTEKVYRSLL